MASDLVERLRHCSQNTRDEYLHELTGRAADRITQQDSVIAGLVEALLSAATALPVLRDMCHHAKLRIGAERAADMIDEITEALAKAKESRDD